MNNREQFEVWYLESWGHTEDNHESLFERCHDGDTYYRLGVRMAYESWQAASKASEQQLAAVVAENVGLKSNLMFWDADNPELPYEHPDEIAMECEIAYDDTFEVQVAARMPNRKYRVVIMTDDDCQTEQVVSEEIQTPATDAFLAEVRASAIEELMEKSLWDTANCLSGIGAFDKANDRKAVQGIIRDELKERVTEFAAQLRQGAAL